MPSRAKALIHQILNVRKGKVSMPSRAKAPFLRTNAEMQRHGYGKCINALSG